MNNTKIFIPTLLSLFLIVSISISTPVCAKQNNVAKHKRSVVIYRDNYGVPQIYAKDTYGLFYGYGYSVATDRLFEMEMIRRTSEGTVAAVLGPAWINFDKGVRSNFSPASIHAQYDALSQTNKEIFEGYAAGVNARIKEVLADQANLLPEEFTHFGFLPKPDWTGYDVVMIFIGSIANHYSDFPVGLRNLTLLDNLEAVHPSDVAMEIFNQLEWANDPGAPTTIPAGEDVVTTSSKKNSEQIAKYDIKYMDLNHTSLTETAQTSLTKSQEQLLASIGLGAQAGPYCTSNVWLLGKKKTYTGGSILQNGPQFGWWNPGFVYEVGLHGAGFNVEGNTPFGLPALFFAHNDDIAWGSTAGLGADVDIYQEQLCSTNPHAGVVPGYEFNGQCLDMEKRTDTINVKGQSPVTVNVYRTVHGFVVQFGPPPGILPYDYTGGANVAYSKRRAWKGHEVESLVAWIDSMKAENFAQFRDAASHQALTINWYYADRRGNIGYIHTGMYPIRQASEDFRLPASGTGDMEWLGILPFDQNPQVYDPAQGYITNWNNKPRVDWLGSFWGSADRVQTIIKELQAKKRFTPQDAWNIVKRIAFIDLNRAYFLPFLEQAVEGLSPNDPRYLAVLQVEKWDGYRKDLNHDGFYDDPGQTIFQTWLGYMLQETFSTQYNDLGASRASFLSTGYPYSPPTGSTNVSQGTKVLYHALLGAQSTVPNNFDFFHGADPLSVVLAALTDTVTDLTTQYGNDMTTWLLPVVKQEFFPVDFAGVPQADPSEALFLPISMNRGTENDLVVLNPQGVAGGDVCPPGESGFVSPNGIPSSHYQDQMGLYEDFQYKPMLFSFSDVVNNSGPPQILYY